MKPQSHLRYKHSLFQKNNFRVLSQDAFPFSRVTNSMSFIFIITLHFVGFYCLETWKRSKNGSTTKCHVRLEISFPVYICPANWAASEAHQTLSQDDFVLLVNSSGYS